MEEFETSLDFAEAKGVLKHSPEWLLSPVWD